METTHLHIKNMVCNRCIRVVKEELEALKIPVLSIQLGEAVVALETNSAEMFRIKEVLEKSGFGLIEDKKAQTIERIKTLVVDLIHHKDPTTVHINYSDYIADDIGKDYHYLSTLFSTVENITIEKYIILQKIERAKELLIYDELNLSEIAFKMGYSSVAHLSNQFKQVTGLSPSQFKKLQTRDRSPLDQISPTSV